MKIIVKNCQECPFCNNDNEYGKDACNINLEIGAKVWTELPKDSVHELCPLLKENYEIGTVKL